MITAILLAYLAGVGITLFGGAWVLGRALPDFRVASVKRQKKAYPSLNAHLTVDQVPIPGAECVSWILLTIVGAAIWPLAVPMFVMFGSGARHAQQAKDAERRAAEAEAEIAAIKEREGWV